MKKIIYIFLLFGLYSSNAYSQDCNNQNQWDGCLKKSRYYDIYQSPQTNAITLNDTLTYNIVFIGNRDYIISLCSPDIYYPVSFKLFKQDSKEEIYNNASDDYIESVGVGFYNTQNIIIEVTLLADSTDIKNMNPDDKICIGMILHWKKIFKKSI